MNEPLPTPAATALPAAGSVAPHPQASSDHPPGYPSAISSPPASTAQSPSVGQSGHATDLDGSDAVQPAHVPLSRNRHGTWSSENDEDTLVHATDCHAPPGYGTRGLEPPRRQTSAVAQLSSLRDAGGLSVQSGTDRPPGFVEGAMPEQSNLLGPDGTSAVPTNTAEHPPGFAPPTQPLTHAHQGARHITAEQPSGSRQPGSQQQSAGTLQSQKGPSQPRGQQTMQGPRQTPVGNMSSTGVVGDELPPGFPTRSQASAVQSASSQGQLPKSQGNLPSSSAATVDADLPPGFLSQRQPPPLAAHSASSRRQAPVPRPLYAPKLASVTRPPSGLTAEQRSSDQPSMPASAADALPPGFPSALAAAFAPASAPHPGSSQARPSRTALYQAPAPAGGQSGWDIEEPGVTAAASQPHKPVRYQHASVDDDLPPGFATAAQQPTSASQSSLTRSQWQPHVVAPVRERRVSVTKLAATPVSGPTAASSGPTAASSVHAPAQPLRVPAPQSFMTQRKTHSQMMLQPPVAAVAEDTSPDLPPGFPTMQRSASTPGASVAAASASRGTGLDASGSTASAAQVASTDAADLPPGFLVPGAEPQNQTDLPQGFPADKGFTQAAGSVGAPNSSRKDAGRKADSRLPQAGLQRSDAGRKAQLPKAASDNLGQLPPGFVASQAQLVQSQTGMQQSTCPDVPDFPPGYRPGQPAHGLSAGTQQDADKSTPARPPSTSTRPIVYVPPGFAASATRSNPRAQPGQPKLHASQSASGIAQPPLSTQGVHASGAHQQGRMSRDQSVTASNGQSAMLQRPPASGPYRPQTTPTQAAGRGPHPQSPDRPPGFGALPVPQSSGAHQLGAPSAVAPGHAPDPLPSAAIRNVQDFRQSIYDNPCSQLSNTIEYPSECPTRLSVRHAQYDAAQPSHVMYSQAVDEAAAGAPHAGIWSVAGMDVQQSRHLSTLHQDVGASNSSWSSPRHSHYDDKQALTRQSGHRPHQARPPVQHSFHAPQHRHPNPTWAVDNRQRPQSHEAHASMGDWAVPDRPSSDDHLVQPAYKWQQAEARTLHRGASPPPPSAHYGHYSERHQMQHSADQAQHGQYERQHAQRQWQPGEYEPQHAQHGSETAQYEWQHAQHEPQHAQHDPEPAPYEWQHAQHDPEPAQYEWQHAQYEPYHAQHDPQSARYEWQHAQYEPHHAQHDPEPAQYEWQHAQHAQRDPEPAQHQWQHAHYELQHAQHDPEPAHYEGQPSQYEPQHAQHDPAPAHYDRRHAQYELQHHQQVASNKWQHAQHEPQHAQHDEQVTQYEWQHARHEPQRAQHDPEPAQYEREHVQFELQHAQHDSEETQYEWQQAEYERLQAQREWQHAQHEWQRAQHEPQHAQCEPQHAQHELQHCQHERQHAQHGPEDARPARQAWHDYQHSGHLRHVSPARSAGDTTAYSQLRYEQTSPARQGTHHPRAANVQYGHRPPHSGAVRHSHPAVPAASATAAPVSHPASSPARASNTAFDQTPMPADGQSGWDVDEAVADGGPGRSHRGNRRQPPTRDESSSLGSAQEAELWDLVNEEPHQVGLNVHQQQGGSFFNKSNTGYHHAQHSMMESSQQSSRQNSSRLPSSRPSSADSSSQVYQQPQGHSQPRRGRGGSSANQSRQGHVHAVGRRSQTGSTEEQAGSLGTRHRTPQKLKHAVRRMSWVRPKPKPASKLESVKWEEEKPTGPPWKDLKALTREKKGWGWSTDEEPDPSRAVIPPSAEYCDELQLWRSNGPSFLFRQA
ncbi:hypothetical protein ABBQ38_005637 [Trebouxia sp. C0009 RCD-2024]